MSKTIDTNITKNLDEYIKAGRVDKEYPQFYKVLWRASEFGETPTDENCKVYPAIFKYVLISDLEKNPSLFKAIQRREEFIDDGFPCPYESAFTILFASVKESFIHRKFQKELKKSNIKLFTKAEREEYIKNNAEEM